MAESAKESTNKQQNSEEKAFTKVNVYDHGSVREILDSAVAQVMDELGYAEDFTYWDQRLILNTVASLFAVAAYAITWIDEYEIKYTTVGVAIYYCISYYMSYYAPWSNMDIVYCSKKLSEKTSGITFSSEFPMFSDVYTLIGTFSPNSGKTLTQEIEQSICVYFTEDGEFLHDAFKADVESVISILTAKKESAKPKSDKAATPSSTTEASSSASASDAENAKSTLHKRKKQGAK
eukprot:TRINITY_DN6305_c0_g1_i1.p1 TRINITY_DN6305_c0_g1~~TRINITY_DN6305_c0_g1_i1.p1  ORF type:complete len:235 (+),score=59.33 TRINITY_DN6305_c0_g1_i1:73-777(+)